MRALATLYHKMGYVVLGCDESFSFDLINELEESIKVEDISNHKIDSKFKYIVGDTFLAHPTVKMIKSLGFDINSYKDELESLRFNLKVAVCGSHGKTTTTKLLSTLLNSSSVVGDGSAEYKDRNILVFEACEYKNTFLSYYPNIGVFLNCDYDHVDFFKNVDEYKNAFITFAKQCSKVIYNKDDNYLNDILHNDKYSFSLKDITSDLYCEYSDYLGGYNLKLKYKDEANEIYLPMKGIHMIYNFLASYLTCRVIGLNHQEAIVHLNDFQMPKRRLEHKTLNDNILVLDYAHHPTEIEMVYKALREMYKDKNLIAIYEGHTLSRSLYFKEEIRKALSLFDDAYLYPIFYSREKKDKKEKEYYRYLHLKLINNKKISKILNDKNNVITFLGAGEIYKLYRKID